jgi:hypothetical protein
MSIFLDDEILKVFGRSRLIHQIKDPKIQEFLNSPSTETSTFASDPTNRLDILRNQWIQGFKLPTEIQSFQGAYFVEGILGGLNFSLASLESDRKIFSFEGEFDYIGHVSSSRYFPVLKPGAPLPDEAENSVLYFSLPSAIVNSDLNSVFDVAEVFKEVWIDLAYLGTSCPSQLIELPTNTHYVFSSLSKPFGVSELRLGMLFSKSRIQVLEFLKEKHYYNLRSAEIAISLLNNFSPFRCHERNLNAYKRVCESYQLSATDSVLFAMTRSERFQHWRKGSSKLARVPTGQAIQYLYENSDSLISTLDTKL